jgi:large subunit ribosomal protein L15
MVVHIRQKCKRMRGSRNHGWGANDRHRGSGNRGGKGMAGTGKRSDGKKPSIWKDLHYFGKFGFKNPNIKVTIKPITLRTVEQKFKSWLSQKLIEVKAGIYNIDLTKMGYNKLLSNGKVTNKMSITVPYASANAIEKVKAAGGNVTCLSGGKSTESKAGKEDKE